MAITVHSPHSGKAVKVRQEDVGRAVRDEAGRIFYVLPRANGKSYFGSRTRAGGPKEEQHADTIRIAPDQDATIVSAITAHDATGKRRSRSPGTRGKLVILVLAVIVLLFLYLFSPYGPFNWSNVQRGQTPTPNPLPALPEPQTP